MYHQDVDFGVSLSEIQNNDGFTPILPGEYLVKATEVSLKNTKSGNGKYLQFEFVVQEGAHRNRKIFQNVIVQHVNEDAQRIGREWIKSWLMACDGLGTERLMLSFILRHLGRPCMAVITIEDGKNGYQDKNKIQRFRKASDDCDTDEFPF